MFCLDENLFEISSYVFEFDFKNSKNNQKRSKYDQTLKGIRNPNLT